MTSSSIPPADSESSFSQEMAQYLQVYIDESEEELESLVAAILQLETNPHHVDSLQTAFRMLHSLKGSSGMMGFERVAGFAHELEDRFERYRSGQATLDRATATVILRCLDYFREFLSRLRAGRTTEEDTAALLAQLQEVERPGTAPTSAADVSRKATIASSVLPQNRSLSGGLNILIRFRPGLQLADLKARLIISKLSSIGEIVSCEPPIDDVRSFDDLPLFSVTLVTDRPLDDVRKIANVDGVESLDIQGRELTASLFQATAETAPAPATPPSEPFTALVPTAAVIAENELTPSSASLATSETLRVDIGRLNHLMNLTGELVIANARFAQLAGELNLLFPRTSNHKKSQELADRLKERFGVLEDAFQQAQLPHDLWVEFSEGLDDDLKLLELQSEKWGRSHKHFSEIALAVDQLTRVSKNLQRGVLNTRMVPVGPLFNRFKRVIRDLAVERGKQVQLELHGENTELDKQMIDALGDPLLHLVRNSIDHGLESSEQRQAAGKAPAGTLTLEASHRGNNVIITIRDDGAGINTDKIRARLVERGFVAAHHAQELSNEQAIDYIWHPGFSTAESITSISGRGVGMDIVRKSISDLSGTIDVTSTPGEGTIFTIRLPLTLAIIHSLLMRYRDGYFSVPIDEVREIVSIPRDQVHTVHQHRAVDVRGELISLVGMDTVFRWSGDGSSTGGVVESVSSHLDVVILRSRSKTMGLSVDALVGRADLVIKSLSENFQPVRGLLGASILGDGTVCLMLDSSTLFELAAEQAQPPTLN